MPTTFRRRRGARSPISTAAGTCRSQPTLERAQVKIAAAISQSWSLRPTHSDSSTSFGSDSGSLFLAALGDENSRTGGQNVRKDEWVVTSGPSDPACR